MGHLQNALRINKVWSFLGIIFFILILVPPGLSQLYPGMEGEALADAIRADYTPTTILDEDAVKDTLYAQVFFVNDSVRCMYSNFARFLPNDIDPSQYLYNNGSGVESMNLEHGWPRSKGAGDGTDGNTNMYHLFPTRTAINSDRAAHPFGEINDNQTQKWYYKELTMGSTPSGNRDVYSEYINGSFEPRETVKGDVARAMFYFWTIYREDAMAADPFFFDSQRDDLCLWHQQDPVDEAELTRNAIIAQYQGGVDNPFIIDCSLVMRGYCDDLDDCETVAVTNQADESAQIRYLPQRQIFIEDPSDRIWDVRVVNVLGQPFLATDMDSNQSGPYLSLPSGIYLIIAQSDQNRLTAKIFVP